MGPGAIRLLKNTHLLRYAHPSSLQRTGKYASFLRISRALHLDIFDQPGENYFLNNLLVGFLEDCTGGYMYLRARGFSGNKVDVEQQRKIFLLIIAIRIGRRVLEPVLKSDPGWIIRQVCTMRIADCNQLRP
jgi:hypothetical protein